MFLSKYFIVRSNLWRNYFRKEAFSSCLFTSIRNYGAPFGTKPSSWILCFSNSEYQHHTKVSFSSKHIKFYSNDLSQGEEISKELIHISKLFPQPRVTLNELSAKTPQKIFDIHYKQIAVKTKGTKKKMVQGDWVCTYAFTWPEKNKFESTALSKRQAAEKAATMALHWLYMNRHIDGKGLPIYDQNVLDDLRSSINKPLEASISDNSVARIERIWSDYNTGIMPIYEETATRIANISLMLVKDSSIDEDDFSEDEGPSEAGADIFGQYIHPVYGRNISPPSPQAVNRRELLLKKHFESYDEDLTPLPIDEYTSTITSAIDNNRVTIIVGAAGCGKSTRTPAAILKHCGANTSAIVSEPRRVAAIGLAQRVASELGDEVGGLVGYQVRLQSKTPRPPCGSVLYCTSGVLLRRLQTNPGLIGCSHVIIDEAHERDVNTDITLLLLKKALELNPELKIVIMSATLNIDVFTRYFQECPVIEVPGRTFPVEVSHLEDIIGKYNLSLGNTVDNCNRESGRYFVNCQELFEVIKAIDSKEPEGAILVFLPGWADIKTTKRLLDDHYGDSSTHMILPVHSRLSTADQSKMFSKPPPGIRKIVLATNVAETSITIPDVVYVIDTGLHKENRTKEGTGTASLETTWISLAAAKQRAGRAGRVQSGHCFRLYTKEKEAELAPHSTPEILRVPLEQTVLDCKTYARDVMVEDFLSQLPEPPSKKAIEYAVNDLIDLGALTPTEHLTRLGSLISSMSLPPRLGYSLLLSVAAGNILSTANVVTHCAENLELFAEAAERRDEIRDFKRTYNESSDHAALHKIQTEFEITTDRMGKDYSQQWCERRHLRGDRLNYIKKLSNHHLEQLIRSSYIESNPDTDELSRFSELDELTAAILLAGSNTLLISKRHVKTKGKLATTVNMFTSKGDRAHIGSESVNHAISKRSNKTHLLAYYGGQHSHERRALVVYKTSLISPHTALLFCKGDIKVEEMDDGESSMTKLVLPKHRLEVYVPSSQANSILRAREMLWSTFQYYIDRDLKCIAYDDHTTVSRFTAKLMKAVTKILTEAHEEHVMVDSKKYIADEK
ncbi:hypothetical protein evm_001324 [Chilo suppressalis]|nr:hypothetical protein evm_001324 [Chilo suppressalis]